MARPSKPIVIEVSPGELIDKLTILEIKAERIGDAEKLSNVKRELRMLRRVRDSAVELGEELAILSAQLKSVNEQLWDIEDAIRICERDGEFGARFVQLARSVYRTNDVRATLKRSINRLLSSPLVEEKSYEDYEADD